MKKNLFRKVLVCAVVFLFFGFSNLSIISTIKGSNTALLTSEKTIYVDDDNTQGPWDGTIEHPYQFIQDGVGNASSGDTVFVFSGIYHNHVVVHNDSIKLIGEDKNSTTLLGVFYLEGSYIEITGFTICAVEDCGVVVYANHNKIYRNIIYNSLIGVNIGLYGYFIDCYNEVYENVIRSCYIGVGVHGSFNKIYKNKIIYNRESGAHFSFFSNTFENNDVRNNKYGISVHVGISTKIKRNNFIDNEYNGYFRDSFCTSWVRNYWDDWIGIGPKMIRGHKTLPPDGIIYEWINFDFLPARIPYNISVKNGGEYAE